MLVFCGWKASQSLGGKVTATLTGRFIDESMWYLIGGAAMHIAGRVLAPGRRRLLLFPDNITVGINSRL